MPEMLENMLDRLIEILGEDAERDVPWLDRFIIVAFTTAVIVVPCLQYFIK